MFTQRPCGHPLPKGEGRGEGEQRANTHITVLRRRPSSNIPEGFARIVQRFNVCHYPHFSGIGVREFFGIPSGMASLSHAARKRNPSPSGATSNRPSARLAPKLFDVIPAGFNRSYWPVL